MSRGRVAVVGGGLAGLAAAVECLDLGASVTLYEARSRLGGATFSFDRNGLWLDNGQHVALRCCTAYVAFLRRLGVEHLLPFQSRLRVPILSETGRPGMLTRSGLPAPLHLAGTLIRFAPLSPRERVAAARASIALRKLDPDDPALDERTFADWLEEHGQSPNAIASLWNLIALPTLNLPAAEASLAGAARVFRTGLLDSNDACDIGIPAVPFVQLHAEPAVEAIEQGGGKVLTGAPVRSVTARHRVVRDAGTDDAEAVILAVAHDSVGGIAPPGLVDLDALEALGTSPIVNVHIHYDRRVLDGPLAAAINSNVQWIFDRTEAAGARTGQVVAISLSHAVDEIGASVEEIRGRCLPTLERLLPRAREAQVLDLAVTHEPRATFRAAPGTRKLRPGTRTGLDGIYLAGAWTDTGWPATMEGAVRSGVAAARAAVAGLPGSAPAEPAGVVSAGNRS
jgi:squalene-associated FAD-dependent desaturase